MAPVKIYKPSEIQLESALADNELALIKQIASRYRMHLQLINNQQSSRLSDISQGVYVLFSGPDRDSQLLAALMMANEMKIDLGVVDASTLVSQFTGETENNLHRLLLQADEAGFFLMIQEAEFLFGKSAMIQVAPDRSMSIDKNYLFQRLAEFRGMLVLACDDSSQLDRRVKEYLHYTVKFPLKAQKK